MSTKTSKDIGLFKLALAIKKGEETRKGKSKKILYIVDSMSEEEILKSTLKSRKNEIDEATTTGSVGGSYETPVGFVSRKDVKMLDNLKIKSETKMNITLENIEKLVKRTLIHEEVYSQKPSVDNLTYNKAAEGKGKDISNKNAKKGKTYSSYAAKKTQSNTKKTGVESKKSTSESINKVNNSLKNNFKEATVIDVNSDKLQNDDQRIEAYANGMQDLEYDSITDDKKKKNTEYILNKNSMESPNSQDTGVNQQFIDDAKAREGQAYDDYLNKNYNIFGSDVTIKPDSNPKYHHEKQLGVENEIKKLNFKKLFEDTKDMLKRVKRLPSKYKGDNNIFEMSDGINTYKIRWEGHSSTGLPVILEHSNVNKTKSDYERHMMLSEYNTNDRNTKSSTNNVHNVFKKMMDEAREL